MDRVFLKNGGTGSVKQVRHVLVSPEFAQQHAMRMHLVVAGLNMFDSIRAAPPDPKGEAVAVRGDNIPWDCGENTALGHRHNDMLQTLHSHHVPPLPPVTKSPPPQLDSAVLISRHRHRDTPEVVKDIFHHVTDQAHAETFGGPALWGRGVPQEDSFNKHGHVATHSCAAAVPGSTRHRDRSVVVFSHADDINVQDAIRVVRNLREAPRRSRFAKATRLLINRTPVPQPTSAATGVAPHMRGMGGEKTSAMAEGTAYERRPRRELDEGMGTGAGGDSRSQPDDKHDGYGQLLGPPPEVRVPAAPWRKNPLILKRLAPAVNAVERACYGNACDDDVRESPRPDENVHGDSAAFSAPPVNDVSAMADSVPLVAEEAEVQTVTGEAPPARRESRRVAAARRNAVRVRDDPTLNQAMACIHRDRWLEAMLDELHSLSEHGVVELCELPAGYRPLPAKWVLKIKRGAPGEIERFKYRYAATGFEQVYGFDLFDTRAPVGRYAKLRAPLSICAVSDLETKHIDIKCAFLNGVLHQDVYIVQPPMFHDVTCRALKLKKALYGLKQAAREWHKALVELLSEVGFDRCHSDPALLVSKVDRCFNFLRVDDLLIFSEKELLQPLVDKILATFDGRDLKEPSHVLGMEMKRDRVAKTLSISHKQMIFDLLERNKMSGCRCSPTPLVPREKIMSLSEDPTQEQASVSDHKRFIKAIGSIQYML